MSSSVLCSLSIHVTRKQGCDKLTVTALQIEKGCFKYLSMNGTFSMQRYSLILTLQVAAQGGPQAQMAGGILPNESLQVLTVGGGVHWGVGEGVVG